MLKLLSVAAEILRGAWGADVDFRVDVEEELDDMEEDIDDADVGE